MTEFFNVSFYMIHRYVMAFLPEFQQQDSKEAFVFNHPIPPFDKKEWQNKLSSAERWKVYQDSFEVSNTMVDKASDYLLELDNLVFSESFATEGGLSLDDIDLWSRLRSVTLCRGIRWPQKLRNYMDNLSKEGDVQLYDIMAI